MGPTCIACDLSCLLFLAIFQQGFEDDTSFMYAFYWPVHSWRLQFCGCEGNCSYFIISSGQFSCFKCWICSFYEGHSCRDILGAGAALLENSRWKQVDPWVCECTGNPVDPWVCECTGNLVGGSLWTYLGVTCILFWVARMLSLTGVFNTSLYVCCLWWSSHSHGAFI